jgi:hypothetical protein
VEYGEAHTLDKDYFKILGHAVKAMTGVSLIYFSDGTYRLAGTRVNVQIAQSLLLFLAEQVEAMYKIYLPRGMSKSDRATYRKDFKRNCAIRIKQRCDDFKLDHTDNTGRALVAMQSELEAEVEAFFAKNSVKTVKSKIRIRTHTRGASDGRLAGDAAAIQPRMKG